MASARVCATLLLSGGRSGRRRLALELAQAANGWAHACAGRMWSVSERKSKLRCQALVWNARFGGAVPSGQHCPFSTLMTPQSHCPSSAPMTQQTRASSTITRYGSGFEFSREGFREKVPHGHTALDSWINPTTNSFVTVTIMIGPWSR
jgi:hypothetical protein